jgi:ubiquinol-cytochrome c reductase cytochrome b subunit
VPDQMLVAERRVRGDGADTQPTPESPGVVRERLALQGLDYPIAPDANRLAYMLGGLTFFGLLLLIATGVMLDQYYNPNPLAAHDSVVYIMTKVPLGLWLRGLHYWGASIVLVTVFFHTCWVFWRRSYVRPREVTWWAGVGLAMVVFALAFTGTVLRGDQEGGEALAHAVAGAKISGPLGMPLSPDFAQSTNLISRMHSAHVSLLPLMLLLLVGLHFWLIRTIGINSTQPKTSRFSKHLPKLAGYALLLLAMAGVLAALFPPAIGHPSVAGFEVTKPYWPFLWIYVVENTMGMTGMVFAPIVIFGFLFLVPLLDRPREGRPRSRLVTGLALLIVTFYVGGIIYGFFAPQMSHLGMKM